MSVIPAGGGKFEKPDQGLFNGTIIDVVELGPVTTIVPGVGPVTKNKMRIIWVLDKNDSTGKPFQVQGTYTFSMNEKSLLFKTVQQVYAPQAPPTPFDSEYLMGRSNQLFLIKTANPKDANDPYVNVSGLLPLAPGVAAPQAPTGFIRTKDRPAKGTAPAQQAAGSTVATTPTAQPGVPTASQSQPASNDVAF
jgi:hypothetical protein